MKSETKRRIWEVLNALPDVLVPQAKGDYCSLISHSAAELSARAWGRTNVQMHKALKWFEDQNPDAKKTLHELFNLTENRQGVNHACREFEDALRAFELQIQEIDERYGSFSVNDEPKYPDERRHLDTIGS